MSWRNTLILLAAAVVLGVYVFVLDPRLAERRSESQSDAGRVFPGIHAEQIEAIDISTEGGGTARLERREGRWQLVAPVAFPADAAVADALASALADLPREAVFEEPEPLKEYGLDGEPAVRFHVGEKEYALRIGDKTPVGGNTYVTDAQGSRVYAVKTWRLNPMHKSLKQLRDARVLVFDRAGVDAIQVSWPGGKVSLQKKDGVWRLVKPLQELADADAVEGLLSDLSFLRAEEFVDKAPQPGEETGFDDPVLAVTLRSGGGEGSAVTLTVGALRGKDQRLVRGRDGHLYQVAKARVEELPHRVVAYRFKQLSHFAPVDATRFELAFEDPAAQESVLLKGTKSETGWTVTPEPMAPGKASRLLSELSDLDAVDVAAEKLGGKELARLGLDPPRVRVRVFAKEGEEPLADLLLGELQAGRGIPARRPDRPTVFWAPESLAEAVPVSLEAYRNRFASKETPAASPAGSEKSAPEKSASEKPAK